MPVTLTILGAGGWIPAAGRRTSSALVRDGDRALLIDAGTGVAALVEEPALLAGAAELHVLLTHFHLDHVCGLAYLPGIDGLPPTTIHGPGRALYGVPTGELLGPLLRQPFHPVTLKDQGIGVAELPAAATTVIAGREVTTRAQRGHSAPTLGLRLGPELAWITDTAFDSGSAPFAAGCRTIAHEAWYVREDPRNACIHSAAAEAAQVALDAGAERLLLIHQPPVAGEDQALAAEARGRFPGALLAADRLVLDL